MYTYCHNNPVYYSDPSGNFVIALPVLAIAAAAVVLVSTTAIVVSNNPQAQQSFNEMTYDVERGFKDLVDSSKKALNKAKTWGKSLAVKAKHTYEATKTVATVVGTSIIASTAQDILIMFAKKSNKSGKERATDTPSWAKGKKPNPGENGKDFAKRECDERFGKGQYDTGPRSDYSKLKKYGDRAF